MTYVPVVLFVWLLASIATVAVLNIVKSVFAKNGRV